MNVPGMEAIGAKVPVRLVEVDDEKVVRFKSVVTESL
jgi:hypothetical protein